MQKKQTEEQLAAKKIVGYVYKRAPGAPKRWKSSYIHFYTDFCKKKRQGIDGCLDVEVSMYVASSNNYTIILILNLRFIHRFLTTSINAQQNKNKMKEMSQEASRLWKTMPADEKKIWESMSQKEKEEYEKKMGDFEGRLQVPTYTVKKKDVGAPKRKPGAFILFTRAKGPTLKEQNPNAPSTDIVKECGKIWRTMSDAEKKPFKDEEQTLRAQYKIEVEKYKETKAQEEKMALEKLEEERKKLAALSRSNDPEIAQAAAVAASAIPAENVLNPEYVDVVTPALINSDQSSQNTKTKKRKGYDGDGSTQTNDAPKKPPSAFFMFRNYSLPKAKSDYPWLSYHQLIKKLSEVWIEMTEEDKKPYRDREEQLRQQYYFKMRHYKKNMKKQVKLKGGLEDLAQNKIIAEGGIDAVNPYELQVQGAHVNNTEQHVPDAPVAFNDLETMNYQQDYHQDDINYQDDMSYADYNIEPINVNTTKTDDGQEDGSDYNQISHQASIDYGAVKDLFGL